MKNTFVKMFLILDIVENLVYLKFIFIKYIWQ